jgi:hypothetical protein
MVSEKRRQRRTSWSLPLHRLPPERRRPLAPNHQPDCRSSTSNPVRSSLLGSPHSKGCLAGAHAGDARHFRQRNRDVAIAHTGVVAALERIGPGSPLLPSSAPPVMPGDPWRTGALLRTLVRAAGERETKRLECGDGRSSRLGQRLGRRSLPSRDAKNGVALT